eukprot:3904363-Heterocapsa_arctica.AAC.1
MNQWRNRGRRREGAQVLGVGQNVAELLGMAARPAGRTDGADVGREGRHGTVPDIDGPEFPPLPTPGSPVGRRPRSPANADG